MDKANNHITAEQAHHFNLFVTECEDIARRLSKCDSLNESEKATVRIVVGILAMGDVRIYITGCALEGGEIIPI